MKKARELGLPVPTREASVIRNPQEDFAARLEEKRVRVQMADSLVSMVGVCVVFLILVSPAYCSSTPQSFYAYVRTVCFVLMV